MSLEIEFELLAEQYEMMGYPGLKQGEPLTVTLDGGVLLPDPAAESWFAVRKEPLATILQRVGPAHYVFSGPIKRADIQRDAEVETATLLVDCGVPLRVTCAPQEDGRLPFGTWETRYLTGYGRIQGIVEDDFTTSIGQTVDVTLWSFQRLVLTPGDAVLGQWHTTDVLPPTPYRYDRILVTARLHQPIMHRFVQ